MTHLHTSSTLVTPPAVVFAEEHPAGSFGEQEAQLRTVVACLAEMNRSTEADFLAITAKLTDFLSAARTISSVARSVTESILGDTGRSDCQALESVLGEAVQMQAQANAAIELKKVRDTST